MTRPPGAQLLRVLFSQVYKLDRGSSDLTPAMVEDVTGLGGSILLSKLTCKYSYFFEYATNLSFKIRIFAILNSH